MKVPLNIAIQFTYHIQCEYNYSRFAIFNGRCQCADLFELPRHFCTFKISKSIVRLALWFRFRYGFILPYLVMAPIYFALSLSLSIFISLSPSIFFSFSLSLDHWPHANFLEHNFRINYTAMRWRPFSAFANAGSHSQQRAHPNRAFLFINTKKCATNKIQ